MDTTGDSLHDMQIYFDQRMARFEADLQKKSSSNVGSLSGDFAEFKNFILSAMKSFAKQLQKLSQDVDTIEMRSRRKILLLHGVAEEKTEDTAQVVAEVIKHKVQVDCFMPVDIRRCHRMGRQSSAQNPRPILVKFQNVTVRDSIWFSKTKLKGTGVTVSEFLTRSRHKAFVAAREKFGVTKCWTREGCIYVLSPDGKRHQVTCLGDLSKIEVEAPKPAVKTTGTKPKRAAAKK